MSITETGKNAYFELTTCLFLESKLKKIKSDPNVLRQLTATKEAYMRQLLCEETVPDLVQISFENPISDSLLLRTIVPQRQALNQGEVVEFIKYDQLLLEESTGHY
ncbi:hypothetical protein HUJ04_007910 [Dendroctonus ponderosae]|nr:hypothetical protein HUJ04_007910 [Dendroctonus ponderosae]